MDQIDTREEADQFYYQDEQAGQEYYYGQTSNNNGEDYGTLNADDSLLENNQGDTWVQYMDEETGNPYLFNEATGEARWIDMTAPVSNWEKYYDDDGNEYYYNKVSC